MRKNGKSNCKHRYKGGGKVRGCGKAKKGYRKAKMR